MAEWVKEVETYLIEKPEPYYDQIYKSLRQMIVQGGIKPGERIYEAKLAREFNVSRSPVREAVRALEKEGLLLIDEKSRITVYKPTIKDVEDIYQCRMVLESLAVRLTTLHASDREMEEIAMGLEKTKKLIEDEDSRNTEKIMALNTSFHDHMVQFCQNRRLQKQINELRSLTNYYRIINFQGKDRALVILKDHSEIFQHIKVRDADQAAEAMTNHITNDLHHLQKILVKLGQ